MCVLGHGCCIVDDHACRLCCGSFGGCADIVEGGCRHALGGEGCIIEGCANNLEQRCNIVSHAGF
ncbi:protein of unknown function [Sterolibacterium denitrificans]|uniref:Uncharacterized protein n=1 Tax=Sterolibacterium denitrificans TaxID=157592 RepID=A0A7Z7HS00_9PROT|nr:protein of unknown function [Sterolibacterium denitrificans]